jgi:uncharacterized delta-60 repeat protein
VGNYGARLALSASVAWACFAVLGAATATAAVNLRTVQAPSLAQAVTTVRDPASYPTTARTTRAPRPQYLEGQVIVRFKHGTPASKRAALNRLRGARVIRKLLLPDTYVVEFRRSRRPREVAAQYERSSQVRYAEPNFLRHPADTMPDDPSFGELWGLHNVGQTVNGTPGTAGADIGVTDIWDYTTGSDSVTVGVVDTGVDYNHSDLAPNMVAGYDFFDGDSDPMDTVGHGTHMAGIIGARGNNGNGVTGVNWKVKIAPLRVCDEIGCDDAAIADAFTYAGLWQMPIVNASISRTGDPPDVGPNYGNTVSAAIAASPNTLFVAAAGNGGDDEVSDNNDALPQFPCNYSAANVLCVAATDRNDKLSSFSNYGATSVDVAAPGQYILSTWKREGGQDRYAIQSGTSQATAMVSGAAALDLAQNPNRGVAGLKADIINNAVPKSDLTGRVATGGRLKVDFPKASTPPPPSPPTGFDTTFAGTGTASIQFPGATTTVLIDTALQSDGKILVGGYATVGNNDMIVGRLNANGTMDTSFSGDGWATPAFGAAEDYGSGLALQSDGKIVLAGTVNNTSDVGVARFNTNGTLDTAFDGDGKAVTDTGLQDIGNDVAVQPDGKIVVVGYHSGADYDFQLERYNTNGSLDTGFDGDGIATTDMGSGFDAAYGVAIQSDGKIVAVGGTNFFGGAPGNFVLARYNANGALDTSFDGDGKVATDFGGRADSPGEVANAVSILSNGRIVVAGQVPDATTTSLWRYAVAKYLTNGSLDGSFGTGGKVTMNVTGSPNLAGVNGDVSADDLAITPGTGEITVAGWSYPAGFKETLVRFKANGTADTTFGESGVTMPSLCSGQQGKLIGIAAQPDRKSVVIGQNCATPAGSAPVARLKGTSASIGVSPSNTEMNDGGQQVTITAANWRPGITLQLQQCNETGSPVCVTVANGTTDSNGSFTTGTLTLAYPNTGGSCPDATCKLVATGSDGEIVKLPLSFRATTSLTAAPSRGAIIQNDAIRVGDSITVKATLAGATSVPTGSVSFSWCGSLQHPTTCAVGGTSFGSQPVTATGGVGAAATSSPVSFAAPGRYCFRVAYSGDGTHRAATDSSRESCISVRSQPGSGPLAVDDFFETVPGGSIAVDAPGVLLNDLSGPGQTATAQLISGPTNGTFTSPFASNGSFTYQPNNAGVTADSFTYRAQDGLGLSEIVTVTLDMTDSTAVAGSRYKGSRYHGSRYKGSRYKGSRYKGSRYKGSRFKGVNDPAVMTTYGECGPRWVWVNPQVTFFEPVTAEISAALYDANGKRIATSDGFIADGEFYGDLTDPIDLAWPVWNEPAPAGGAYATVFVTVDPLDPNEAGVFSYFNTVGCQT